MYGKVTLIEWHIILGFRPAALFHTENTLVVEDVRIGAVQTYRFVDAVQVEDEMMLGCAGSQAFHHFDGGLVVAVHEIHLESLDAHISIGLCQPRFCIFCSSVTQSTGSCRAG